MTDMKNTLAVKIFRGSLFLFIALFASFLPRILNMPSAQDKANVAATLALFMQGVIWTNIIINYYLQRYIQTHASDGGSITTFKALGAVVRLTIWITLALVALSANK